MSPIQFKKFDNSSEFQQMNTESELDSKAEKAEKPEKAESRVEVELNLNLCRRNLSCLKS